MDKIDNNDNDKSFGKAGAIPKNYQQKNNNNSIAQNREEIFRTNDEEIKESQNQKSDIKLIVDNKENNTNKNCKQCIHIINRTSYPLNEDCPDNEKTDSEYSDSSADDLSFIYDIDIIDEIILLPDNIISEDEISNPDECIYAYRGAAELPEPDPIANAEDDETDFLEMDFDPEPNSEAESFSNLNFFDKRIPQEVLPNQEIEIENLKEVAEPSDLIDKIVIAPIPRNTGTKPKTTVSSDKFYCFSKIEKSNGLTNELSNTSNSSLNSFSSNFDHNIFNETTTCMDCTEKQFLHETKNIEYSRDANCRKCQRNQKDSDKHLIEIKSEKRRPNELALTSDVLRLGKTDRSLSEYFSDEGAIGGNLSLNAVTIYSIDCNEKIIVDGLKLIGIEPDLTELRKYFDENNLETTQMNIVDYILYLSKQNCNYKKLMKSIKLSCAEKLEINFCPALPFSNTPETINVDVLEIRNRWNSKTNLTQILDIKNIMFHKMNVLGKIVNILRQPEQRIRRETNNFIKIPQYYCSGYISITKKSS